MSRAAETDTLAFLQKVLPSRGYYFVATLQQGKERPYFRHFLCDTKEEAAARALHLDASCENVYYACSSYREPFILVKNKEGEDKKRERVHDNVLLVRSFWIDLDVKNEPTAYQTQQEAIVGLGAFLKASRLPVPLVVSSGNGLHCYWSLTEDIAPAQWLTAARLLKSLAFKLGLKQDPSRTSDHASVLHPVGTYNRKDPQVPKIVEFVRDAEPIEFIKFFSLLESACRAQGVDTPKIPGKASIAADINANYLVPTDYPDSHASLIADRCPQIRAMRDTGGNVPEPVWYGAIQVLRCTVEGRDIIHAWSSGYAGYSHEETERKISQVSDMGPLTCEKFEERNPTGCVGCPYKGKITSPIQLGYSPGAPACAAPPLLGSPPGTFENSLGIRGLVPLGPGLPVLPLFDLQSARVVRFLDHAPPAQRWLLKDFLPAGKVGAIIAPGGTGKSQFALQLLTSIATGHPLCGHWQVGETGSVLGLFAEDDEQELHRRLFYTIRALGFAGGDALSKHMYLRSMTALDNLMTRVDRTGQVYLTDFVERLVFTASPIDDLKLIVIDPASRFRGGNENSAEDMTRFVEAMERVSKATGANVIAIHHANKGSMNAVEQSQSAARGSSAFTDGVRWQMNLIGFNSSDARDYGIPEADRRRFLKAEVTKSNYAAPQAPVHLVRGNHGVLEATALRLRKDAHTVELQKEALYVIRDHPGEYSITGIIEAKDKFGIDAGDKEIRGALKKAVDIMYLDVAEGRGSKLMLTAKGKAFLAGTEITESARGMDNGWQIGNDRQGTAPNEIFH